MQAKETARKNGISYVAGQVDPEIEGYNGKTWNNSLSSNASLEGAPSGGEWMGTSTAYGVGGGREATRNMGNTTTQTERGYSNEVHAQGGLQASQTIPFQQGDLATGGQMQVATSGMDPQKLMLMGSMLGITNGPKGTTMGPNGTYGDGKFQASDVINWAQQHPWLWKIGKTLGNLVIPGAATIGDAALRYGVSHGIGDGVPGNASIRRVYK